MDFKNISNLLKQGNVSWKSIENSLKKAGKDDASIRNIESIFRKIDKTNDGNISIKEWLEYEEDFQNLDKDNDNHIKSEELNEADSTNRLKNSDADSINSFLNEMNHAVIENEKTTSQTAENGLKKDVQGNTITYARAGEGFNTTAERLGFKKGTPEYDEFIRANQEAVKRKWFNIGEEVKIPASISDKLNKKDLISESEVKNTKKAHKQTNKQTNTSSTSSINQKGEPPKAIKDEIAKWGIDAKTLVKQNPDGTWTVVANSSKWMADNKVGQIVYTYDKSGVRKSAKYYYNDGKTTNINWSNGKIVSKNEISKSAPQNLQKASADLQKKYGGNAKIQYNESTKNYDVIITNPKDKSIKSMVISLDKKAWQEKETKAQAVKGALEDMGNKLSTKATGIASAVGGFFGGGVGSVIGGVVGTVAGSDVKGAVKSAARHLESNIQAEDYITNVTINYKNGMISKTAYTKGIKGKPKIVKEGATAKTQKTSQQKANSAVTDKTGEHITSAAKIAFRYPSNAPKTAKEFGNSLCDNKEKLMRQLNIDNDTYNMLAQTAMGIAKQETNFGESTNRQKAKDFMRIPSDSIAILQDSIGFDNKSYSGKDWSQGITQLKFTLHNQDPSVKKDLEALGITNEIQLQDPKVSAVATIVVLAHLNRQIDTKEIQNGIKVAQQKTVTYDGYELKNNVAIKTGNTVSWKNNITRQDVLCALWNGQTAKVKKGDFEHGGNNYANSVQKYANEYHLTEDKNSRTIAKENSDIHRTFKNMDNSGQMGSVVFMPAMYTDKQKHLNSSVEINSLRTTLLNKGVDKNLVNQLSTALQNGELGFDYGLSKSEMEGLTAGDIKLLLRHLDSLKRNMSLNTSDGISSSEAQILRSNYASSVTKSEREFRSEYLNNHSQVKNLSESDKKNTLNAKATNSGSSSYVSNNGTRKGFRHETPKSVNRYTTKGQIPSQDYALANAGYKIASKNADNTSSGRCLTGVKQAFDLAGIDTKTTLDSQGHNMEYYGNTPKEVKKWFMNNPQMFTEVKYVNLGNNTGRSINASDIKSLPAGYVVIWEPEAGSDQAGHIEITNGNGQGYADATDNLEWNVYTSDKGGNGKGEHGHFVVYKLNTNNCSIGPDGKLKFN